MAQMQEAHFVGTVSQSSIYGLTPLFTDESTRKVLVASSKSKIYCTEYCKNQQNVIFSTKEVQFTYIPGQAEIISVDTFNQARHEDFVVGITFGKTDTNRKQSQYFNIYSSWEPSNECDLDNIAQECLSISLDFIPFHLTHAELFVNGLKEVVWLLSGSDCQVHLYREDKSHQTYSKEPVDVRFPEFKDLDSVVMWMDFVTSRTTRLTAFGCQDGTVAVTLLTVDPAVQVRSSWRIQHDGPISNVRLFRDSQLDIPKDGSILDCPIHLLVTNALEVCVVYRDVAKSGLRLSTQRILPKSSRYDAASCGLVADIDMDGQNEVLVGTYGQQLLAYKWEEGPEGKYHLYHQQMFPSPVLAMRYVDITGDGMRELLVLTTRGLHILQHDLKVVTDLCVQRMKFLLQNYSEDELKKMLHASE